MIMRKVLVSFLVAIVAISANAQVTFTGAQASQTYSFTSSVSNGVASTYSWTEVTDANGIATFSGATNALNVSVAISAGALAAQQATVRLTASSSVGACAGAAQDLIIVVGNAAFTASRVQTSPSYCQNSVGNVIAVALAKNAGYAAYTINSVEYYFDANANNQRDVAEPIVSMAPTTQANVNIPVNTATAGTQNLRIYSVTGSLAAATVGAIQPVGGSAVGDNITINELPILTPIIPN